MEKSFRGKTDSNCSGLFIYRLIYLFSYLNHLRSYNAGAGPGKQPVGSSVLLPRHELQGWRRQVHGDHQI